MAEKVIVLKNKPPIAEPGESRFRIRYAEVLNPQQLAAVVHRDSALLAESCSGRVFGSTGWAPHSVSVPLAVLRERLYKQISRKRNEVSEGQRAVSSVVAQLIA